MKIEREGRKPTSGLRQEQTLLPGRQAGVGGPPPNIRCQKVTGVSYLDCTRPEAADRNSAAHNQAPTMPPSHQRHGLGLAQGTLANPRGRPVAIARRAPP